jgi:putative PIN family toxin of toxin-antitoxin system
MKKNKKFVFDTNTLISSFLIRNSTSFAALEKARNSGQIIFSAETFLEFESVLMRTKFDRYFSKEERLLIINAVSDEAKFEKVKSELTICRDPKDDKFLNLALDSKASCIITGDQDLLVLHPFKNIPVLSPSDFLNTF